MLYSIASFSFIVLSISLFLVSGMHSVMALFSRNERKAEEHRICSKLMAKIGFIVAMIVIAINIFGG